MKKNITIIKYTYAREQEIFLFMAYAGTVKALLTVILTVSNDRIAMHESTNNQ